MTFGGSIARAFGANAGAEVAWAGAGAGKVVAGLLGFPPGDLGWTGRGGGAMFSGRALKAFSAGRGGTVGKGAGDIATGDEVTFAAGGPVRLATESTDGELSLETTGGAAGAGLSHREGAASLTGAPHCSQNSPLRSSGPLQKRQVGSSTAWGVNRGIFSVPANPNSEGVASASRRGETSSPSPTWVPH